MKIFFLFLELWSVWIWLPLGIIMVIAIFGNYGFCLIDFSGVVHEIIPSYLPSGANITTSPSRNYSGTQ